MSSDHTHDDDSPLEPQTDQERELLEAYRTLDDAGWAWLRWTALAELGRRSHPSDDDAE